MTLSPRALAVVICLAAAGCIGGPTSEWPTSEHDDDGPKTPPSDGKADAGALAPSIDAGKPASVGDTTSTSPCPSAFGGGSDAGVGDPDDPSNPYDNDPDEPFAGDAGCR